MSSPPKINQVRDRLRLLIERHREAHAFMPTIHQEYAYAESLARIYGQLSPEAQNRLHSDIEALHRRVFQLPIPRRTMPVQVIAVSSAMATTSSDVVAIAAKDVKLEEIVTEMRELQDSQQRPEDVRALLKKSLPGALPRFDSARKAYQEYKSRIGTEEAAAGAMRNFLAGFKGRLQERAKHSSTENTPTMETTVERIFSSAPTRTDIERQIEHGKILFGELSNKTKDKDHHSSVHLDAQWSQVLEYAFVIASALD